MLSNCYDALGCKLVQEREVAVEVVERWNTPARLRGRGERKCKKRGAYTHALRLLSGANRVLFIAIPSSPCRQSLIAPLEPVFPWKDSTVSMLSIALIMY